MFSCFRSYRAWVVLGAAILLGGYLVIWHSAHVAAVLPFLVIAACPLMHIFGHRGHGHHHGNRASGTPPPPASRQAPDEKGE